MIEVVSDTNGGAARVYCIDDMYGDRYGLRHVVPRGALVRVTALHAPAVMACFAALDGWAARVELGADALDPTTDQEVIPLNDGVVDALYLDRTLTEPEPTGLRTTWRLFSSGTTGKPTPTDHTFDNLASSAKPDNGVQAAPRRWGLLYQPTRMAGVQVLLQSLLCREELIDVTGLRGTQKRVQSMAERGVNAISATPTMWRQILQTPGSDALQLRQITLGGEPASQQLLTLLSAKFGARVTHTYASTESGVVLSVSDGREGFPTRWLSGYQGPALELRAGMLHVYAPQSSAAHADGFVATGDLAEIANGRVRIVGRSSTVVNIGGEKIAPESVEALIRRHPFVVDVAVSSRRSTFSGNILAARVVIKRGVSTADRNEMQTVLRKWVSDQMTPAHVPALVEVVTDLAVNSTGKATREA